MWQRLPTFLLTLYQVISLQRQTWVIPAIDLKDNIEILLSSPLPTAMGNSGLVVRSITSPHCGVTLRARRLFAIFHRRFG